MDATISYTRFIEISNLYYDITDITDITNNQSVTLIAHFNKLINAYIALTLIMQ